jgi:hypothetical protein
LVLTVIASEAKQSTRKRHRSFWIATPGSALLAMTATGFLSDLLDTGRSGKLREEPGLGHFSHSSANG